MNEKLGKQQHNIKTICTFETSERNKNNLSTVKSQNMETIQEKQHKVEQKANVHFTFECYRSVDLEKQISLIEFYEALSSVECTASFESQTTLPGIISTKFFIDRSCSSISSVLQEIRFLVLTS